MTDELLNFSEDLVGDGWSIVRHDVDPDEPTQRQSRVTAVKDRIQAEYNADSNVKAVVLIGHIPVPYSGVFDISGHPESRGAYPADVYYGDVVGANGAWPDSAESYTAHDPRKNNYSTDYKFDQERIPSNVELQVGRIDFHGLSVFGHSGVADYEKELLKHYFTKNRNYRKKLRTLQTPNRALVADLKYTEYYWEWAPLATGWGHFSGLVNGGGNVHFRNLTDDNNQFNFISHLKNNEYYLTQIAGTSQGYDRMDNNPLRVLPPISLSPLQYPPDHKKYLSSDFVGADGIKTFFIALGASYIPDWDSPNNFLRSALASTNYTVAAMTADAPSFAFHRLNTGATIGEILRISQNNKGFPISLASDQALPACTYNAGAEQLISSVRSSLSSTAIDSGAGGYALAVGNCVLIKNQADPIQNGIYFVVQLGGGAANWILQRVPYADSNAQLLNAYCVVLHGSAVGTAWVNTSANGTFNIGNATTAPSGSITFQSTSNGSYHHRYWNHNIADVLELNNANAEAYDYWYGNGLNRVHIALLGDPTLRFHVLAPPTSPTYTASSDANVTLNWTASADLLPSPGTGDGYYVYRSFSKNGPFVRVSGSTPLTGTTFTQTGVKKGYYHYMVRAVKRTAAYEGYYANLSQGAFVAVNKTTFGNNWTGSELSRSGMPNAHFTYAHAINSGNAIVGYYERYSGGTEEKAVHWYWSPPTALSGVWGSSDLTYANGVNDSYIVIGTANKYENSTWGATIRAFRWEMYGGTVTVLNTLPSGGATVGTAINASGASVGFGWNQQTYNRAIRWDAGQTSATDLNSLAGDDLEFESHAYAINKAGYIVGRSLNANLDDHAFVLPPGKLLDLAGVDLGTLDDPTDSSVAYSINDFNQIVGSSDDGTDVKPFITGLNQSAPDSIPLISGDTSGDAYGINNSGVVVGESGGKAFIWQAGYSSAIDLNNFKPTGLSGLTLKCAEAINHNGVIVGWGLDSGGNRRAFMLSPQ
ncbi:MAG TPA: DUF3466 family protein [Verrucomicrobiae bacterium]